MANYNVLTLSEPVTDFTVTTSPATIKVQCGLPEDSQRKRVWAVCKAGGIPAHPYDGVRVLMTGDATVTATISGLTNDTEYGVRIFVEGKYGYQTALEGAAATATPRAGQPASVFPVGTRIQIPTQNGNKRFIIVVFDRSGYPADSFLAWSVDIYETVTIKTSNCLTVMRASLEKFYQSICEPVKSEVFQVDARWATYVSDDEWHTVTQDHAFLLSSGEMIAPGEWGYGGAESIAYLNKTNRAKGAVYFTRCAGYDRLGFQGDVINKDGGLMGHHGYSDALSYGIVPTLCLPKSMLFSLEPNPDGSYSPIL